MEPFDTDLQGCFERTAEPGSGRIGIVQGRVAPNIVDGWGRGVLPDAGRWTFTGHVDAPGRATLSVTTEGGEERLVDAVRVGSPPDDSLTLRPIGTGVPPRVLTRCS